MKAVFEASAICIEPWTQPYWRPLGIKRKIKPSFLTQHHQTSKMRKRLKDTLQTLVASLARRVEEVITIKRSHVRALTSTQLGMKSEHEAMSSHPVSVPHLRNGTNAHKHSHKREPSLRLLPCAQNLTSTLLNTNGHQFLQCPPKSCEKSSQEGGGGCSGKVREPTSY